MVKEKNIGSKFIGKNGMWVFIEIFLVKLAVGWSNSRYKLILTVGSKFGSNFTISLHITVGNTP